LYVCPRPQKLSGRSAAGGSLTEGLEGLAVLLLGERMVGGLAGFLGAVVGVVVCFADQGLENRDLLLGRAPPAPT